MNNILKSSSAGDYAIAQGLFIILKLVGVISWSWDYVLIPLWTWFLRLLIAVLEMFISHIKSRQTDGGNSQ